MVDAPDIIIENLTIQNTSGRVGQAVALHVEGDRFICKNWRFGKPVIKMPNTTMQ
ncbi:hypothetical protein [Arcicella aquatica]|uniref:hypothetical protein n=1 Tax=Arcicella aquatica TaxID=217141 RepID=UPI002B1F90D4|nr:hypothetical protein [Arcicella aquatica]